MKLKKIIIGLLFLILNINCTVEAMFASYQEAQAFCNSVTPNAFACTEGYMGVDIGIPNSTNCPSDNANPNSPGGVGFYKGKPENILYCRSGNRFTPAQQISKNIQYSASGIVSNTPCAIEGQYHDTNTTCVPVTTDCNAGDLYNNFFDIQSKGCKHDTNLTLCIGSTDKFCPPLNDCKASGFICTNDPRTIAAADSSKVSIIAGVKTAADEKAALAATAAASATAASNNKASLSTAANDNQLSLKAIADVVTASATASAASVAAAVGAYSAALTASVSAASSAANSATSAAAAVAGSADIAAKAAIIPTSNVGNANAIYTQIGDQLAGTLAALNDSIAGLGVGSGGTGPGGGGTGGTGTGSGGTAPAETGLAKDATLQALSKKLNSDTSPFTPVPLGVRTLDESVAALGSKLKSKLPTVVYSDVSPACPVFSKFIPFLNFTMILDQFCTMDSTIRPVLQTMSVFTYSVMSFFIIFGA